MHIAFLLLIKYYNTIYLITKIIIVMIVLVAAGILNYTRMSNRVTGLA